MRTRKVVVLPYDVAWQSAFEKIKGEIKESIGDLIIGIEHVGSTSVEGMTAKPCIDIDVIIKDYTAFATVVESLSCWRTSPPRSVRRSSYRRSRTRPANRRDT